MLLVGQPAPHSIMSKLSTINITYHCIEFPVPPADTRGRDTSLLFANFYLFAALLVYVYVCRCVAYVCM